MDRHPTVISHHVAENIDRALSAIRLHLGMDIAFVAEFLGTNRMFRSVRFGAAETRIRAGGLVPMAQGYCRHIIDGRLPELIPDTRDVPFAFAMPETKAFPIGAHLSVPIRVENGRVFGTFCCFSYKPKPDLDERDLQLMRTFSAMIASELSVDIAEHGIRQGKMERLNTVIEGGGPTIVFQPIVRLEDKALIGVEALSRFNFLPQRTPDVWFAEAHAVGMGPALELTAASKAIAEAGPLPEPFFLSLNLSAQTLSDPGFADVLSAYDPQRLVIEITEHDPVHDYAAISKALAPLRAQGVRVAIDDAGAGYSSMRHVLTIRPDIIKFDVSLTRDINKDPARQAMVAALCEFARRTETKVVAEGVETAEEDAALKELRVEMAQGYKFGRPQELSALLADAAASSVRDFIAAQGRGISITEEARQPRAHRQSWIAKP